MFAGGKNWATTAVVDAVHLVNDPSALVAVTDATMNRPTSAADNTYVEPVCPSTTVHEAGFAVARAAADVHLNHAFVNEVGLPPQVPRLTVNVFGTRAVPVIAGNVVLVGGAALTVGRDELPGTCAEAMFGNGADTTRARTAATMRPSLVKEFMMLRLLVICSQCRATAFNNQTIVING